MALATTDETYSILCSIQCPDGVDRDKVDFYVELLCHLVWITSCTVGALAGDLLPVDVKGIDFSATAFFVTVVVNQWQQFGSKIPVITGFISAIVFYFTLGASNFILPALSISLGALIIMRDRIQLKMGGTKNG
jgi:4-azaleucine resistance transporter AzlC